jgi:hypothetical protein
MLLSIKKSVEDSQLYAKYIMCFPLVDSDFLGMKISGKVSNGQSYNVLQLIGETDRFILLTNNFNKDSL